MIHKDDIGLGYRPPHHTMILEQDHNIKWFEALADNYMDIGSIPFYKLKEIREKFPVVFHSVGMNLGAPEALNKEYMLSLIHI